MHRRYNLVHFLLSSIVVLGLTLLMVGADPQAQIAFTSERDGHRQIYVMDGNGGQPRNLTNNPHDDTDPAWFNPAFAVAPAGKKFTMWGWFKQVDQ
jgi:hypothetical protein